MFGKKGSVNHPRARINKLKLWMPFNTETLDAPHLLNEFPGEQQRVILFPVHRPSRRPGLAQHQFITMPIITLCWPPGHVVRLFCRPRAAHPPPAMHAVTRNTRAGLSLVPSITNSSMQSGDCFPRLHTPLPYAHAHLNYNTPHTPRQHPFDFMRWEASKLLCKPGWSFCYFLNQGS